MNILEDLRYTKTHEWARTTDRGLEVGITDFAQQELKDVVYIELPAVGQRVEAGQPCAVIESVKAAFDIYAPVSGTVVHINEGLADAPQRINEDCYGRGWLFVVTPSSGEEALLTATAYRRLLEAGGH